MPQNASPASRTSYSAMGYGRHDYEACYGLDHEWQVSALHCHDFYEFYIHFQGAKFYCIDNQVYPMSAYQLLVMPPFLMHGLLNEHVSACYERCFLYISPDTLKLCGTGQIDLEQFFSSHVHNGHFYFSMTEEEGESCKRIMQDLSRTQHDTASLSRFSNHTKLLQFLSIICQVMNRAEKPVEPIVVNEAMQDVLAYINEHYTTPIKLDPLARQFGVSVSFLSHEFVKYTGRSVYDYVLYRRVLLAKELIASGRPLNEVAYQCGFNDYSSFLRSFTKMAGMSPSAYRKGDPRPFTHT